MFISIEMNLCCIFQYWAEKLEQVYPKHEIVFRLREKIYSTGDTKENTKELEHLYITELRKKLGFKFASLYAKIKEYQVSSRYLDGFLQVNPDFYKAHSLRGEIYENLNQKEKAIEAYKRSLDLNESQKDILLKVCELYCQVDIDPDRAKYWAEKLEQVYPKHEIVFRLREKIYSTGDTKENTKELEHLYITELRKRPTDAGTQIKLLRLYKDQGRVNEAYTIAVKEETSGPHSYNIEWYHCLLDIYEEYKQESGQRVNGSFHIQLLWAQCHLVAISLERAKIIDCMEALQQFDQTLLSVDKVSCSSDQWIVFQQEMRAQLYMLSGILLLKRAKEGRLDWKEASTLAAPCFLLSYSIQPPNIKAAWCVQASDEDKKWYQRWHDIACFRACQSGHMIRILSGSQAREWANQVQDQICNTQGKDRLFAVLFNHTYVNANRDTSYLYNNSQFTTFSPRLPDEQDLKLQDRAMEKLQPGKLHYMLWRALQYYSIRDKSQQNYNMHIFDSLQYGNLKLDTAFPTTLCQLDIEAFLYAAVHEVANRLYVALPQPDVPLMLPVLISENLGSLEQSKWWSAAYQLVNNVNKEHQSEARHTLQQGLEKIRLVGNHGLDATTLIHLARTFAERLQENKAVPHDVSLANLVDEQNALQARVEHYWHGAVKVLEKIQSGKNVTLPSYQLFSNHDNQLEAEDIDQLLDEARYNLGLVSMEAAEYQAAIEIFQQVSWPEGTFERGQCFKKLAQQSANRSFESMDDDERNHQVALLMKAQDCFRIVLDQVGGEHKNPLYGKAGDEYEQVATQIEKLTYDQDPREHSILVESSPVADYVSRLTPQYVGTPLRTPHTPQVHNLSRSMVYSTPRGRPASDVGVHTQRTPARHYHQPSPDRLDAQLQTLSRSNKEILEEFKKSRKHTHRLESRIEALEEDKRRSEEAFDSLRRRVDDLGRDVVDLKDSHRRQFEETQEGNRRHRQALNEELMKLSELVKSVQEAQKQASAHQLAASHAANQAAANQAAVNQAAANQAAANQAAANQAQVLLPPPQPPQMALPQHLQHAQAGGLMLPPGGMSPAMYGSPMRAPRPMMPQQYPGAYGTGYPEYDYAYMQRFQQQFPGMPAQYGVPNHEMQARVAAAREAMPDIFIGGPEDFEEVYDDEDADGYEEEHTVTRRGMKQPGSRSGQSLRANGAAPADMSSQMYSMYSPPIVSGPPMPGPGFFSSPTIPVDGISPSMGSTPNVAVSAAAVSGANLFMATKDQTPTNYPLTMPTGQNPTGSVPGGSSAPTTPKVKSPTKSVGDEHDYETDGDATTPESSFTDFKPLVSLPEVDTQTGEENEKVLFSNRAKLFRFIEAQWKERGLGTMKILQNEESGAVRILMRREQILKVCANHCIKSDMDIDYKDPDDKKTLTWRATDYTEQEPRLEQFCCRFKTPELAAEFKQAFEKAKEIAKKFGTPKKPSTPRTSVKDIEKSTDSVDASSTMPKISDAASGIVKPAVTFGGSATFGSTTTTPASDILKSFASKVGGTEQNGGKTTVGGFTFKAAPVVKPTDEPVQPKADPVKEEKSESKESKPFAGFTFGASPAKPVFGAFTSSSSSTVPSFGSTATTVPSFSSIAKEGDTHFKSAGKAAPFEGVGQAVFKSRSPGKGSGEPAEDDEQVEEYEPEVDFKPIVTLPTNVQLTTGEEDEQKLFGNRAKLYKNDPDSKEWKERGVGEIKILKHKESGNCRILMRREQVHKICANHLINKDMKLLPMSTSETSWCWYAHDYSEDEAKAEQFAIRFKTSDLAQEFKGIFEDCILHSSVDEKEQPKPVKKEEKPAGTLAEQFKAKTGEWDCESCYVRNKSDSKRCVACESLKPGEVDDQPKVTSSTKSSITLGTAGFKFGGQAGQAFSGQSFGGQSGQSTNTTSSTTGGFSFQGGTGFGAVKFGSFTQAKPPQSSEVSPATKNENKKSEEKPTSTTGNLGNIFKAKSGEWECEACYVRNKADSKKCVACMTVKPGEIIDDVSSTITSTSNLKFGSAGGFTFDGSSSVSSSSQVADSSSKGFNFGSMTETTVTTTTKTPEKGADSAISSTSFGFGGKSGFSFAGVTPVKVDKSKPQTPKTPTSPGEEGYYVNQDGEDDHIHFAPVVKLPDNVEVKTGEEDEDLLYHHRAKLYRFTDNEWKERGVGEVRLLRHKQTEKARILMRREQVLKLCMNHVISKDLELKPMPNAKGKAWIWHATDFADDNQSHEQFAIRFKSEDIANKFREIFEKARDGPKSLPIVEYVPELKLSKSDVKTPVKKESANTSITNTSLSGSASKSSLEAFSFKSPDTTPKSTPKSLFGDKPALFGSGTSSVFGQATKNVFGQGSSSVFGQPSSGSLFGGTPKSGGVFGGSEKGGLEEDKAKSEKAKSGNSLLAKLLVEPIKDVPTDQALDLTKDDDVIIIKEESIPDSEVQEAREWKLPDGFYSYRRRPQCKGCLGCLTDEFDFSTIGSGKSVDVPHTKVEKQHKKPAKATDVPKPVPKDTEADSTSKPESMMFGNSSSFGDFATIAAKSSGGFSFGKSSPDSKPFAFAGAGASVFGKSPTKGASTQGDDDDEVEQSPDVHFEPIVQLPEVVDLETGEEDEEKIFSHRAKLYRYDNQQWKERGIGDMKILKNKNTGRFRLLMRREQVLKVACNHYLTADMVLQPLQTSETAWCWYAVDHTENQPKNEQFALRFKTKDLAANFKDKFTECQRLLQTEVLPSTSHTEEYRESGVSGSSHKDTDDYDADSGEEELAHMFTKRVTMFYVDDEGAPNQVGMGELEVIYDDDVFGARIRMKSDDDKMICNHIICRKYSLINNEKKKICEWVAKDFSTDEPIRHTFRIQFSSPNAVMEFDKVFQQGLEWARESEIDEVTDGMMLPREMTKPQVARESAQQ